MDGSGGSGGGSAGRAGRGTFWDRFRGTWLYRAMPWLLPYGVVVLSVAIDYSLPNNIAFTSALVAAPLAAAALWTFRGTIAVSVVTVGALCWLVFARDALLPLERWVRLLTVLVVCAMSVVINRALQHSVVRLASARRVAEAAQLSVLPTPPEQVGELSVAVRYEAAQEGARIGGDLYAVAASPFGVRMMVADVRGKGLPAVDAVTVVLGAFREAAERVAELAEVAHWMDQALHRERRQRDGLERTEGFVTAILVEIAAEDPGTLRIVNRGHPSPLLLRDGAVEPLEPGSFSLPLGLDDLGQQTPGVESAAFLPGALLLLYTDGMTEARDAGGVFYDPVARLAGRRFTGPTALLDEVLADVAEHTGGVTADDLALLAVARGPDGNRAPD
ncbi:PP2C family protein-serine/threonine phosphatase [Streptomyces zingiberis]|uniref:Serine/threonine-protein phosphatase n=1 Tax=Streptomyces zingiberis TaxID=2053010 RepID=A0ABX1C1J8_9ACTN|nr:PP2C family protein-serine/threonine phosphatase [Streptomyces zingiberis]NJQ03293.1 serine/threonine-protein phosphatase [Streptomyces zingiberis]